MDRLLSEQAVIEAIHAYWLNEIKADGETDRSIKTNTRHSKNICGAIKALPSAEPQIIHCSDCRWNDGTAYCEFHYRDVKGTDFCSWGEEN